MAELWGGADGHRRRFEVYAAHHGAARGVVLDVLRERAGTWCTATEIHALARGRALVGIALVRKLLPVLEGEGLLESLARPMTDRGRMRHWWRLRQGGEQQPGGEP